MVGGASFTELRRIVIDKMISAGGWVVNDRQREIGGRRVFEVIAQTPSTNGKPDQVWNFYFAEVDGEFTRLTTRTRRQPTTKLPPTLRSSSADSRRPKQPKQEASKPTLKGDTFDYRKTSQWKIHHKSHSPNCCESFPSSAVRTFTSPPARRRRCASTALSVRSTAIAR